MDAELDALATNPALYNEARREISARIGQGRFRAALLALHGNQCVLTGISAPSALRAAHIHRWADCRDDPRAQRDPENGLLLSANVDCLFEAGLIAFANDSTVLLSPLLARRIAQRSDSRLTCGCAMCPRRASATIWPGIASAPAAAMNFNP